MILNPSKTEFITFGQGQCPPICVNGSIIEEAKSVKLLGITLNKGLTWKGHMEKLQSELAQNIGGLKCLAYHLPKSTTCSLIEPHFLAKATYGLEMMCNPLNVTDPTINQLQKHLNDAMRAALRKHRSGHHKITDLQRESQCPSIREIAISKIAGVAYDIYGCDSPWNDLNSAESFAYTKQTRSATSGKLRFGKNQEMNIGYVAGQMWNHIHDVHQSTITANCTRNEFIALSRKILQ